MNKRQGAEKFWMVSVTGGGPTSVRHRAKSDAVAEAKRLAMRTDARVYVLETITAFETPPAVLIELEVRPSQDAPIRFSPSTSVPTKEIKTAAEWRKIYAYAPWLFNPWTRESRSKEDIDSDPYGLLIDPSEEAGR